MNDTTIHIDGSCPFLTCLRTQPHDHPVCPACGAVRFGNIFCPTCKIRRPEITIPEVDE